MSKQDVRQARPIIQELALFATSGSSKRAHRDMQKRPAARHAWQQAVSFPIRREGLSFLIFDMILVAPVARDIAQAGTLVRLPGRLQQEMMDLAMEAGRRAGSREDIL